MNDPHLRHRILSMPCDQWVILGMEAHICIMLTACDLLVAGKQAIVPAEAITAFDKEKKELALQEMRADGVRITCVETLIYELCENARAPLFKEILSLIKEVRAHGS